jgi:hypothetical protein
MAILSIRSQSFTRLGDYSINDIILQNEYTQAQTISIYIWKIKKGVETNASSSKIGQKRRATITRQTYHGTSPHKCSICIHKQSH